MTQQTIAPGRYRIDPRTASVRFTIKEFFGLNTVRGTLAVREGEITVAEDPARSAVHVAVDAASLTTGRPRRDRDVISRRFLDVARCPELTFASRTIAPTGAGSAAMAGIMTVRGVAQEVRFEVTESRSSGGEWRLVARARIDRTAFGVRAAVPFVDRFVDVEVEITPGVTL
ncbi:YceI family protein [Nonomuraea sp. NPDC005650]|uniref:YceI family protein n=1 Tax=Nonomuraea sp. NPDC005650 TaxID=3157045 RepID=UPI0033BAC9E5